MAFSAGQTLTAAALNAATKKAVAYGNRTSDTSGITTETAILRLDDHAIVSGHRYRVSTTCRPFSSTATDTYKVRFRYTTDGSTPTTSSTQLGSGYEELSHRSCSHFVTYAPGADQTFSVIITLARATGAGTFSVNPESFMELLVEDMGDDPGDTGTDL